MENFKKMGFKTKACLKTSKDNNQLVHRICRDPN